MRRIAKVKTPVLRIPLRKSALSASAAARRPFPAWISAEDGVACLNAPGVTLRVRDGLVLRAVSQRKPAKGRKASGSDGAR